MKETYLQYIEQYDKRLLDFINEYEMSEYTFIKNEHSKFVILLGVVKQYKQFSDIGILVGDEILNYNDINGVSYKEAIKHIKKVGIDKFYYTTKKKLSFLESKKLQYESELMPFPDRSKEPTIKERKTLPEINTFKTTFSDNQLNYIYEGLQKEFIDTDRETFIKVFSGKPASELNKKIKWIIEYKGNLHKTALREFISLMGINPIEQRIVDVCFTDKNGYSIILPKPKRKEYSIYYKEIEDLIKNLPTH